jgi:dTDP-4-dehydrorhamnose 3,5-epimerase
MTNTVRLFEPRRFSDDRGWFSETYSDGKLSASGIDLRFVQDNQSRSKHPGTIRGIHFQRPPFAQAKLVRCLRGSIVDYAIDLRKDSPTFGRSVAVELSETNGRQLYIPVGFGHAFVTLEADVDVAYKVSAPYAPECDGGILWSDPAIAIDWPLPASGPVLSKKDLELQSLDGFDSPFVYDGTPLAEPTVEIW